MQRAIAVVSAVVVATSCLSAATASDAATPKPFVGSLVTYSPTAKTESKAGLKVAMLEVNWAHFEPKRRVVDRTYANYVGSEFKKFRAAGMRVTLGLGLHFTPAWVLATPANRLRDQHGTMSRQADFIFNRNVRIAADWYLQQLNQVIRFKDVWATRITSGGDAELVYPTGSFWASSVGAARGTNRPTSLRRNPFPGRSPGTLHKVASRRTWAHWYVGALADVADWQISSIYRLGFRGYNQLVMPGQGIRPRQWNALMTSGLVEGSLGRGAAWDVVLRHLRHRKHVTVYVSSVADGTADGSVCTGADSQLSIYDHKIFYWSAARWLTYLAHRYGMSVAGEPPGYPNTTAGRKHYQDRSTAGLLATAMRQATSCGFLGLYWAHDSQIVDGTMPLSALARYVTATATPPATAK